MQVGDLLYEGKAKKIFATENKEAVLVRYKDDATAFNGEKKAQLQGKGELNNQISAILFQYLNNKGIKTHFIKLVSATEQLVKNVKIIPLEVVVRNQVAGSLAKRTGLPEGEKLSRPIVEIYYKDDTLGDPLFNDDHVQVLKLATSEQQQEMKKIALTVNQWLRPLFAEQEVQLVDFKLEFGLDSQNQVLLADEISPDTCRLWDEHTGEKMDKDRFRRDMGRVIESYQEILNRLGGNQIV